MTEQTPKRRAHKAWQFSIAQLLVAISLVAVTCAAFRLDIGVGISVLHLTIAIAIAAVRTRAAVRHHEELWDALDHSDFVRRSETNQLANTSFGVALAALFFFYVGFGIAFMLVVILFPFGTMMGRNLHWFLVLVLFGAGMLSSAWWLKWTWPRSYFVRKGEPPSPSANTG